MNTSWAALVLAAVLFPACGGEPAASGGSLGVFEALSGGDVSGYRRAVEPPQWSFPRDHGAHPEFRTEWWYWTGNLCGEDGAEYGFQLVFFQQAVASAMEPRSSAMAARHLVLAHAALTDVREGAYRHAERLARAAGGLAGVAGPAPGVPFRVHCEDWSATAADETGLFPLRLRVAERDFAFDLELDQPEPVVAQGERGLSRKGGEPGNASVYYSIPRMRVQGTVRSGARSAAVRGSAWLDREWSTSSLAEGQVGWDWFSLQFEGGEELMWYQLRREDGSVDPWSKGSFVHADGRVEVLAPAQVRLAPGRRWLPDDRAAGYPVQWELQVPHLGLDLRIEAKVDHQELRTVVRYWEGCVRVQGTREGQPLGGEGYLEMTGYVEGARR